MTVIKSIYLHINVIYCPLGSDKCTLKYTTFV
jgi:hypothetical protein